MVFAYCMVKNHKKIYLMKKLSPKGQLYLEFGVLVITVILAFIFWDSYFIYPIKLFVVLLHESSHSIVAFLSGGRVDEIRVNYELGGMCVVYGGNPYLIASAGYIGSLIFGGLLFVSAKYHKFSRYLCYSLGLYFVLITIFYIKVLFGILFTLSFAAILFIAPAVLSGTIYSYGLKLLGIISCCYVVVDIREDLFVSSVTSSDARILAGLTGVHHLVWASLILLISIVVLYQLLRFNFRKA